MRIGLKRSVPLFAVWGLMSLVILFFENYNASLKIELVELMAVNTILFILGVIHILRAVLSLKSENPHHFTTVIYSGFVIRLFVCILIAFIYIYLRTPYINKITLFSGMAMYMIYSTAESIIMKYVLKK